MASEVVGSSPIAHPTFFYPGRFLDTRGNGLFFLHPSGPPCYNKRMSEKYTKKKTPLKLSEIAQELRRIADGLENHEFTYGTGRIPIDEPNFLKTRSEIKGDNAYFSLSIRMGIADSTTTDTTRKKPTKPGKAKKQRSSGSGEAKKVKKEINRLWKNLRRKIEANELPEPAEGKSLLKLWEDYTLFAEASWSDEWRECKGKIEQCLQAANNEQWTEAESTVKEVLRLTKECHRQHK